ncbi:MAG: hypothetical protein ITG01_14630 [Comamonas sp.]|jgi:uncharacterized protein|nr:hypothetical protein [Comamonas sp.]
MKYLLVALVLLIALQIWRSNRRKAAVPPPSAKRQLREPEDMVTCAHCGVHLPSSDALVNADQHSYCSREHQNLGPK